MPNIIITEADFEKLSDDTKKELWKLLQGSFQFDLMNVNDAEENKWENSAELYEQILDARRKAKTNYQAYLTRIMELQKELPRVITSGIPIKFDALSIEVALSVLLGLSDDSKKVIAALLEHGELTREAMAEILGGAKKINGTVGSINRRLGKRFSRDLYPPAYINDVKLIEFDKNYKLTCDPRTIEVALVIEKSGYQIDDGNILLKFSSNYSLRDDAEVKLEAFAIEMAMNGNAFVKEHFLDFYIDDPLNGNDLTISRDVNLAQTISSATFAVQSSDSEIWQIESDYLTSRIIGNPFLCEKVPEVHIAPDPINDFWANDFLYRKEEFKKYQNENSEGETND